MNESTALVADAYLEPTRWAQMEKLAQSLVQSRALPRDVQNAAQALVKMQYGLEIGLKPMQALTGTMIVNGAVNPWGKTVTYLLRQGGWRISYVDKPDSCTATITKDDETYTDTLTFDEAVKSKWVYQYRKDANGNKVKDRDGNYVQDLKVGWYEGANRKMKLRYGALSMLLKTYVPDVLGGAPDIAEVAEDFVIVEETPAEKPKTTTVIEQTPEQQKQGLAEFLEKNKNNPKAVPKPTEKAKKVVKNEETTSNSDENAQKSKVGPSDKAEAIEGEVIETSESKE